MKLIFNYIETEILINLLNDVNIFGHYTIKKGEKIWRIRKFQENTDFSDEREWAPPPQQNQNRCNFKNDIALYCGSEESICLFETHVNKNEKYVISSYTVLEDLKLGSFNRLIGPISQKKYIESVLFNACLTAPSSVNKMNEELFQYLDLRFQDENFDYKSYKQILKDNKNMLLPIKLGYYNSYKNYYNLTSLLCLVLRKNYPLGIKYNSCYLPIETLGIKCSHYNIVLYEPALNKIKWNHDDTIKTAHDSYCGKDSLRLIFEN